MGDTGRRSLLNGTRVFTAFDRLHGGQYYLLFTRGKVVKKADQAAGLNWRGIPQLYWLLALCDSTLWLDHLECDKHKATHTLLSIIGPISM